MQAEQTRWWQQKRVTCAKAAEVSPRHQQESAPIPSSLHHGLVSNPVTQLEGRAVPTGSVCFCSDSYPRFLDSPSRDEPPPFSFRTSFSLLRRMDARSLLKEPLLFREPEPSWGQRSRLHKRRQQLKRAESKVRVGPNWLIIKWNWIKSTVLVRWLNKFMLVTNNLIILAGLKPRGDGLANTEQRGCSHTGQPGIKPVGGAWIVFQTFPLFNGFRRGADRSSGVSPGDFPHSEVYARVTGSLHSRLFTPASIVTERKKTDGEATASGEHRLQVLLEVKKDKLSDAQTRDRTGDKHLYRTQRSP